MNHLTVGFDVDDVLLPSADHTIRWYNRYHGTQLTRDNWYVNLPISVWKASTEHEIVERVNGILNSDDFLSEITPIEGALQVLDELDAAGDEHFAVTSRPPLLAAMTHRALELCYPGKFPEGVVTFIDHSTASGRINTMTKVEIAVAKHATHFVDDFEHHLRPMGEAGITPLLFGKGYRWNSDAKTPGLARVSDMEELKEFLQYERTK
ncbi:MAG: hypothetical protein JWN12_578 [Candidatus Saccharibacteria bacterium]|nr:hypothetical protein [Candidatus Saccharibacteria bacterium]